MGPSLMDDEWIYGGRLEQIHQTLVQGRPNGMPAWGGKIPDEQIWQIAAYVRSMSLPADFGGAERADALADRPHRMPGTPSRMQAGRRPMTLPITTPPPPRARTRPMRRTQKLPIFVLTLALGSVATVAGAAQTQRRTLVVCADPNNLPFSNRSGQGFENKLAELLARDLRAHVEYVWWAQRRGYVRNTLNEARCDLWPGVATGVDMDEPPRIRTTVPPMYSSRAGREHLTGLSLDDPRLKRLSIGVQMIGNDATNTPPAQALALRGHHRQRPWLHALWQLRTAQSSQRPSSGPWSKVTSR